jgi:hypothetical protein
MVIEFCWESQKERDLDIGWRIILRWFLRIRMGWYGLNSSGYRLGPIGGLLNMIMNLRVL